MPKCKRFTNPLRSAPQPENGFDQTNDEVFHNSPTDISPPNHDSAIQSNPDSNMDHSLPNQGSQEHTRPFGGRQSSEYWTVETVGTDGTIKTRRLKVKEMDNLSRDEQVVVNFEDEQAIGEAQGLLAGYLGTLAVDCKLFPINFSKWSGPLGIPRSRFEECFSNLLKPKFHFKISEGIAKRYCKLSLAKKWSQHRIKLWKEFYDPCMSRQWASFIQYRFLPSTMEMCRRNKEARKKQTIPHTGGSKPISRKRHEIFLETGRKISRGEMYIETHKKRDGSFVTDEARDIAEQIEVLMTQNEKDESRPSTNDAIGKVFGEEHSGRVRCMGMGATPTNTFRNGNHPSQLANSSTSMSSTTNYSQADFKRLESKFDGTLAAFKAYFLAKEGRIPVELTSIFDHGTQANDIENETITPTTGRTSSGASNENREDIV
ncbi:uncharacterized protein LOC130939176 isoform X1 [Arachis stenosperma]|uniref:uncharacterized protein LOC130939176 isoform X1 n=3 Tax=Arachis stenosperma TaxID=217475 RepID=UPI0025AD5201|nr:uncharacterized protein LOC130939176 isoform X1 [Arachis stenosperma]